MEPVERMARALCRADGYAENTAFQSGSMWASYMREAVEIMRGRKADVILGALVAVIESDHASVEMRTKARYALKEYGRGTP